MRIARKITLAGPSPLAVTLQSSLESAGQFIYSWGFILPSVSDFVRVSKRSRMSTTFRWVPMDGAGISALDKSTGAASITFFGLAYCSSDHRGVLVAALHEEPLGNVENLLDRLLRVLIACHGHLRPCYSDKHTMSGVRVEKGWRQKSPTAVTASLETRPTMDGEPER